MSALADVLSAAQRKSFSPGVHDCAIFAADVVQAVHGYDPAAWYRGKSYVDRLEIYKRGPLVHAAAAAKRNGWKQTETPRDGDVGAVRVAGKWTLCARANGAWYFPSERGLFVWLRLTPTLVWSTARGPR